MTKLPQITLFSPPSRSFNHYRPPLALLCLAGYLLKNKISVKIIDITDKQVFRNQNFWKNVDTYRQEIEKKALDEYRKTPTPIVGITCYTPEYMEVLNLAKEIKSINPKAKIIVGGIHPTLYPEELLNEENSPVDYEVIGDGEETLLELVQEITKKRPRLSLIKGIAFKNKDKEIVITPNRHLNDNLDELFYPAYKLIDMPYYTTASPYAIRGCFLRSFYLQATRGCPSTCTFCVAKKLRQFNGGGKCTRIRSAKSLIKEIKSLHHQYNLDSFYFIDDLFTINRQNVFEFCRLLKENNLHLFWGCSSKVSTLNEELLKVMSESGCVQIDFGIERGSDQALRDIQKGISIKMIEDTFSLCQKYHIRTFANFLINLPGETKKDLLDINKLIERINPDVNTINVFIPYPGTEIYDHHTYKFSKSEYVELFNSTVLINDFPEKYRFAKHKIDLNAWAEKYNRKYNRILPIIEFHLNPRYLYFLLKSKNKLDYLLQTKNLFLEFLNQKFFHL